MGMGRKKGHVRGVGEAGMRGGWGLRRGRMSGMCGGKAGESKV